MNEEELNARRANETPEQGKANFIEHMKDVATSVKPKKMREKVKEELKHVPDWPDPDPQKELRMLYNVCRMRSLGKKATSKQTAKEVLMKCISDLQPKYPDYSFKYDEAFFDKCD